MKKFILLFVIFAQPALAQSKAIDRISNGFGNCLVALEIRSDEISDLKNQIESLKKEAERLHEKYETTDKKKDE